MCGAKWRAGGALASGSSLRKALYKEAVSSINESIPNRFMTVSSASSPPSMKAAAARASMVVAMYFGVEVYSVIWSMAGKQLGRPILLKRAHSSLSLKAVVFMEFLGESQRRCEDIK